MPPRSETAGTPRNAQVPYISSPARRKRYERKNRAFRRQGEWFFVPEPSLVVDEKLVLRNEPLRRGAGKSHLVEQLFRSGGETVHVCTKHPNGISEKEYAELLRVNPKVGRWGWRVMRRNPGVYARGTVRHDDHESGLIGASPITDANVRVAQLDQSATVRRRKFVVQIHVGAPFCGS